MTWVPAPPGVPALARYGHEPTRDEVALLRAILNRAAIPPKLFCDDGSPLDPGIERLLPSLHGHPDLAGRPDLARRVAALRRRSAYRYFRLKGELRAALAILAPAKIDLLLLKGFPLASLYYDDVGLRPMSDLDLGVRPERFAEAQSLLIAAGFRRYDPEAPGIMPPAEPALGFAPHAMTLINPNGVELDLHHHVLMCAGWPGADDDFWADAQPFAVGDIEAWTLDAADHLLHAILHGVVRNPVSPVRWVVDAARLIERSPGGIDWQRLCRRAQALDCRGPLEAALRHLADNYGCAVPSATLQTLAHLPFSMSSDRWFKVAGLRAPPPSGFRSRVARLLLDYRRHERRADRRSPSALGLLRYFMIKWRIERYRDLPREILARCLPR
jgi:hypothetical protein